MISRLLQLLVLTALFVGCSDPGPPNVLLISLDTLRADRLGCYGYDRPTTPALDRLAAEGLLFEDVTSVSPWTLPSHASLFTSLYPSQHGAKNEQTALGDEPPTLSEVFREAGYHTGAIVNTHFLADRYGLLRGFEHQEYVSEWEDPSATAPKQIKSAPKIVDRALEWIEGRRERPFFLFLHFYDAHSDYAPAPKYRGLLVRPYAGPASGTSRQLLGWRSTGRTLTESDVRYLSDLYDAQLRQLDDQLDRFLKELARLGHDEDTFIAVTSDHGEELWDHGSLLHGRTYYQEVIAVPWLLRGPGIHPGQRLSAPVSLIDIPVTLVDLAHLRPPPIWQGRSAVPLWKGDARSAPPRALFAEADHHDVQPDMQRLVRLDRYKLIHDRVREETRVFDLSQDPEERVSRADEDLLVLPALQAELERFLRHETTSGEPIGELDERTRRLLEQLGYAR